MKEKGKVKRSIHYFDLTVQRAEESGEYSLCKNQKQSMLGIFEKIKQGDEKLKNSKNENLNQIMEELIYNTELGDKLYVEVDKIDETNNIICFRLVLCRTDAFPYIEKEGRLESIYKMVRGDFSIAEVTHCVIFLEEGIMGAEYNNNGARPSSIAAYVNVKNNGNIKLNCTPKLKGDAFNKIVDGKEFSLFQLKVKNTPTMKVVLRDQMGLLASTVAEVDELDSYEIILKRRITKKHKGFAPIFNRKQIEKFTRTYNEDIEKFKINQGIYEDPVNLLSDKMITKQQFVITKNKTIDTKEMYKAIKDYYKECIEKE